MPTDKEIALGNEILRGEVGSVCHGTNLVGTDDVDQMAVFIETPENVCGLSPCDHYIYRDAAEGERSKPGDLDLTMYSLRKFCRLATQGNPSVLILLWLNKYEYFDHLGDRLINMRQLFISKDSGKRFLGYLISQKKSLTGEHSQKVNRPELIEKYGFDTKFAMHALRLGYEGIQLLTERRLTLPVAEPRLSTLRAVRQGQVPFKDVLSLIDEAELQLRELVDNCTLEADRIAINRRLVKMHQDHWMSITPDAPKN